MKPFPNRERYLEILRNMTPQQKLERAFELTDFANAAFKAGLRNRKPGISEDDLDHLYLEKLRACHNQNY
jgi:hypothetical protein